MAAADAEASEDAGGRHEEIDEPDAADAPAERSFEVAADGELDGGEAAVLSLQYSGAPGPGAKAGPLDW